VNQSTLQGGKQRARENVHGRILQKKPDLSIAIFDKGTIPAIRPILTAACLRLIIIRSFAQTYLAECNRIVIEIHQAEIKASWFAQCAREA